MSLSTSEMLLNSLANTRPSVMVVAVFCLVIGNPAIGFSTAGERKESTASEAFDHLPSRQDSMPVEMSGRKDTLPGSINV